MKTEITLITLIAMAIIAVFSIAYSLTPEPAKAIPTSGHTSLGLEVLYEEIEVKV